MTDAASHLRSIVDHDGAVILDIENDQFFSLNPVGAYIWTHLLGGRSIEEIARKLAEETQTEVAIVIADVNDFITELKAKRLLHFPE